MKHTIRILCAACLFLAAASFAFAGGSKEKAAPAPQSGTTQPAPAPSASTPIAPGQGTAPAANISADESYVFGMYFGLNIQQSLQSMDIAPNIDEFVNGLRESMTGSPTRISEADAQVIFQQTITASAQKQYQPLIDADTAFLANNKTLPGVVTLPSGLQYKVIKEGTGPKPGPTSTVKVNYTGTLTDGTPFDSGETEFRLNGVVPGFSEGIQQMTAGSEYILYFPAELGYGNNPNHQLGFRALIFNVTLKEIVK
jgi:FKBP-type peptidyl-prolyl cis-trans isomerase